MGSISTSDKGSRPVALVTGASRGIGAATARALASRGHDIFITYARQQGPAEQVLSECQELGARAVAARADFADTSAVDALFAHFDAEFSHLDVLVNNAGTLPPAAPVRDLTGDRLAHTLTVNTTAPALCAAAAARRMSTTDGGHGGVIVNVSSRAAQRGGAGEFVDYAMSKAAIDILTHGLAQEVAQDEIRVVGVRPGLIDTDMNADRPGRVQRLLGTVPMRRVGTPEEVASVISWLATPEAGYVTGVTIDVSGGR